MFVSDSMPTNPTNTDGAASGSSKSRGSGDKSDKGRKKLKGPAIHTARAWVENVKRGARAPEVGLPVENPNRVDLILAIKDAVDFIVKNSPERSSRYRVWKSTLTDISDKRKIDPLPEMALKLTFFHILLAVDSTGRNPTYLGGNPPTDSEGKKLDGHSWVRGIQDGTLAAPDIAGFANFEGNEQQLKVAILAGWAFISGNRRSVGSRRMDLWDSMLFGKLPWLDSAPKGVLRAFLWEMMDAVEITQRQLKATKGTTVPDLDEIRSVAESRRSSTSAGSVGISS
ncbi:hypothetical protein LTR37_013022 [Vermiconidia calcicola]|uniref:Uncharacterized protein n=1 Tax=Vermiconidia calcicola TaxID=1690605 RepID=A0ACC3MXS4_9PEZI|nr:hypothetical protein LTR37_013022 [Vermiconidia calcicola]